MNKETMQMLLEYLNQMFPISIGFRNDLTTMMSETVTLRKVVTFLNVGDPVNYLKLEVYPETQKSKEFMLLLEKQIDFERAEMMSLKPRGRFLYFAERHNYALAHLPNRLCACFVNIHEADYGKYKAAYLRGK